jgi:hypothetical protein
MIHSTVFRRFLAVMFAACALVFMGCSDSDDGGELSDYTGATPFTVSVAAAPGTSYFSFAGGLLAANEKSADTATPNWDIAFTNGRVILTNSGDTATDLNSGGAGGVWSTGGTTFKNLTKLPGNAKFDGDYATDTKTYVNASASADAPTGAGMPTTQNPLNVMTYIGYGFGDGISDGTNYATDGHAPFADYKYNADQFYAMIPESMGSYIGTMKVYIIKHGDGAGYTELQITSMTGGTSGQPRVYTGYYQISP